MLIKTVITTTSPTEPCLQFSRTRLFNETFTIKEENIKIKIKPPSEKLGVMIVGISGNNGSTFAASLLAYKKGLNWENKNGTHSIDFLGSIYQYGTLNIGYKKFKENKSKENDKDKKINY